MAYGASKAAQYAIRALVHLAEQPAAQVVPVRTVSHAEQIPQHFLAKVVKQLVQSGLVGAFKGPGGGLQLARPPHQIAVAEVIRAVDGTNFLEGCFLGLDACGEENPCAMHAEWKVVRARLVADLERISIAQLARTGSDST